MVSAHSRKRPVIITECMKVAVQSVVVAENNVMVTVHSIQVAVHVGIMYVAMGYNVVLL